MRLAGVLLAIALALAPTIPVSAESRRPGPRREIRDRSGVLMGEIRSRADGRLDARDRNGRLLGYYVPKTDKTHDRNGRMIAKGDILSALVVEAAAPRRR